MNKAINIHGHRAGGKKRKMKRKKESHWSYPEPYKDGEIEASSRGNLSKVTCRIEGIAGTRKQDFCPLASHIPLPWANTNLGNKTYTQI